MTYSPTDGTALSNVANFRSLGGLPVAGGQVRAGLLFRSATLGNASPADGDALVELGIRRVFDFRTDGERESAPDRLPDAIVGVALDVLGDHAGDLAASFGHLGAPGQQIGSPPSPAQANEFSRAIEAALGGGRGPAMLRDSYREIVRSASALGAYRAFFLALGADDEEFAPSLFHCTTGKDRTGWAAAAFLMLLGASPDTIMDDYLRTNTDILPMIQPMLDRAEGAGIDPELLRPVLTVQESFLETALGEMRDQFGSIDAYFSRGLGLDESRLGTLRERFVAGA